MSDPIPMNNQSRPCSKKQVDQFLNSNDYRLEDNELIAHLDSCTECRQYLDSQAATPALWNDLSTLLKPDEFDEAGAVDFSAATIGHVWQKPIAAQDVIDALAPTDDPHRLGRLGNYEVTGVIGVGGMGVVLKAVDPSLDRVVAIKMMAPYLASNESARKRFLREAKAAAAVLHPNVIPIHSVASGASLPYLVMSYIRGGSLQKRLDQEGRLQTVEVLRIGSQIAAGLAAAHDQGLVHRDIKPENILLEEGVERVTITDFGLARSVDDSSVTLCGNIAGTPEYMSPEQARGESIDQASDLFSLGSVLYTLCTGRVPFRAESSHAVMRKLIDDEPIPIRKLNSEIPTWLCDIITRLMAKQKSNRFKSASEVRGLLEACLSHLQQPTVVTLPEIPQASSRRIPRFNLYSGRRILAMLTTTFLLVWMAGAFGLLFQDTKPNSDTAANQSPLQPETVKSQEKSGNAESKELTWKSLLGTDVPEHYPTDALSLVDGLNKSRGHWHFEGTILQNGQKSDFKADCQIEGEVKKAIAKGGNPNWQISIAWPREKPTRSLNCILMALFEPDGIKLLLITKSPMKDIAAASGNPQLFDGVWDAKNQTLTWTRKAKPGAAPKGEGREALKGEQGGVFEMVVKANGELMFRNFPQDESTQITGRNGVRVGEPFGEEEFKSIRLPNGYRVFSASPSEVYLQDKDRERVTGVSIDKLGCQGDFIFGLLTLQPGRPTKDSDTPGYFWIDSRTGKLTKGMSLGDWRDALKAAGIEEPVLLEPFNFEGY